MEFERFELVYKINQNKSLIRLLGEEFFQRNNAQGHIIYKNKKYRLLEYVETKNVPEDEFKINMIFYKKLNNKSFMFENCDSLIKFSQPQNDAKNYHSQIIKVHEEEENLFDFLEESKTKEEDIINKNRMNFYINYKYEKK